MDVTKEETTASKNKPELLTPQLAIPSSREVPQGTDTPVKRGFISTRNKARGSSDHKKSTSQKPHEQRPGQQEPRLLTHTAELAGTAEPPARAPPRPSFCPHCGADCPAGGGTADVALTAEAALSRATTAGSTQVTAETPRPSLLQKLRLPGAPSRKQAPALTVETPHGPAHREAFPGGWSEQTGSRAPCRPAVRGAGAASCGFCSPPSSASLALCPGSSLPGMEPGQVLSRKC
ncbi:uncharacterized protein LOC143655434 [Tamandua tetradactyla]|uniref:uncharacterized protein LOC143655434 n=1 Tax=Tamandua tetradactyla TaxID=48850 RepID=UPI004053F0FD